MENNLFHVGTFLYLVALCTLLLKLIVTKECVGISGKTQFLHAVVFTTRFLDIVVYNSWVETCLKGLHLLLVYWIALSVFYFYRKTYDIEKDDFRIELLVIPCAILAFLLSDYTNTYEVFWTYSVFLEAVAILPQYCLTIKKKYVEKTLLFYIGMLAFYKAFYVVHWAYILYVKGEYDKIAFATGVIQLYFYCDYFARVVMIFKQIEKFSFPRINCTGCKEKIACDVCLKLIYTLQSH